MRPPPFVLSLPASSNTMINSPSCWNIGLLISGSMLFLSHVSAVPSEQSWASLHRLGTMFEKAGSVPLARSVVNWVNGTMLHACPVGSFHVREQSKDVVLPRIVAGIATE